MNPDDARSRAISEWLDEFSAHRVPDHLDEVLRQTQARRQRPAWSIPERWLPVDLTSRAIPVSAPRVGRLLLLALLLLALVAAAGLLAGSQRHRVPPPFGLARNGAVMDWGGGDIYLADSVNAVPRAIIAGAANDLAPLLSRDGRKFAFLRALSDHETMIMLANIDGSGIRQVTDKPMTDMDWYEWAADDELAVVHSDQDRRVLSIVDVASGAVRRLDLGGLDVDNDVYWVPSETDTLVLTAYVHGNPDAPHAIYSIRRDGTGLAQLTQPRSGPFYNGLNVSPDGRTVAYWNWEDDQSLDGKGSHLHFLDLASGADRIVTFDPSADGETDLHFSPDARHVVLQREQSDAQLLISSIDGSSPALLVGPHFSLDAEPDYGFSPDGNTVYLAFANTKPQYIDVKTGAIATGPVPFQSFAGYQRLAP
jgi:hypothetical protein